MRANKGKNTKPEIILRKELWHIGAGGYRLHWMKATGHPDIAYPNKKIAIFVHGCFWHRCPRCNLPLPKSHKAFWKEKFDKNQKRDSKKKKTLEDDGWKVFQFWECMIEDDARKCAQTISRYIEKITNEKAGR